MGERMNKIELLDDVEKKKTTSVLVPEKAIRNHRRSAWDTTEHQGNRQQSPVPPQRQLTLDVTDMPLVLDIAAAAATAHPVDVDDDHDDDIDNASDADDIIKDINDDDDNDNCCNQTIVTSSPSVSS